MAQAIRRVRVLDVGISSIILAVFAAASLAILYTNRSRVREEGLRIGIAVSLSVAAGALALGGVPLLYYWRKDANVDRARMSTMTGAQLRNIMLLMVVVVVGCAALLVGEVLELVAHVRVNWGWQIAFSVLTVLLICWVVQGVVQTAFLFKDASRGAARASGAAVAPNGTPMPGAEEFKYDDPSTVI